jgi:ABC-type polysaccharide/polyol phosphate transport system ATPase subunit
VTHDPKAMERFADRALLIQNSRVEAVGDPQEVLKKYHQPNRPAW